MNQTLMVTTLGYFMFQPLLHMWYNKYCVMYYPVCGMVHIKDPLLLIRMSGPCSGFPHSLSGSFPYIQHHLTVNKMCVIT